MTIREDQPARSIRGKTPRNSHVRIVFVFALFISLQAVHGATTTGDAHPVSRLEASKDPSGIFLPGVAVADEAMLVRSTYALKGSNPLWSRAGDISEQARAGPTFRHRGDPMDSDRATMARIPWRSWLLG